MLDDLGCELDVTDRGSLALEIINDYAYDLVFMDIGLPDMDGLAVTSAIRKIEEQHQRKPIPVVAMTAHAMKEDIENCKQAGMNDILTKPINSQALKNVILKWT